MNEFNSNLAAHDHRLGYDNAHDDLVERGRIYALQRLKGLSRDHEGPAFVNGYSERLDLAYGEAVEHMSVQAVDTKPVDIDWREAAGEDFDGFSFYQSFQYELGERDITLVARGPGSVVTHVYSKGTLFSEDEYDEYEYEHGDGELLPGALDEGEFEECFRVEPYHHGVEGPMMNYWYPLDEHERGYFGGGFNAETAAAKVTGSLCVVEVGGEYGLALTGGGMDMSWDICEAFVALEMLPPTHFADLPRMAGHHDTDTHRLVLHAMERALVWQQEWLGHRWERVRKLRTDLQEGRL